MSLVKTISIALLMCVFASTILGQDEKTTKQIVSEMKDEDLVLKLSSKNQEEAKYAEFEIFKRGEKMFPVLFKQKGNMSLYEGWCLRDPIAEMGISSPNEDATPEEINEGIKGGWYVTVEVASLYLISAIYYDNLAFAQVPYLRGSKPVEDNHYNTSERTKKAWKASEKWYKKLQKEGLEKLRAYKEFPLKSTEIHFYGTQPKRDRKDDPFCKIE